MTQNAALNSALNALGNAGKRARVHDAQMVIKLPEQVKNLVKEFAAADNVSDAAIVRFALAEYFERRGLGR